MAQPNKTRNPWILICCGNGLQVNRCVRIIKKIRQALFKLTVFSCYLVDRCNQKKVLFTDRYFVFTFGILLIVLNPGCICRDG